jgi:chromosome segregation ATPase
MTAPDPAPRRSPLAGPARAVRRVLAPAGLELEGQLRSLREQFTRLHEHDARLRQENAELREQLADAVRRLDALEQRAARTEEQIAGPPDAGDGGLAAEVAQLRDGLREERRLHLRVAELADVVTELVLPLHDREVDPAALARLRPDTL